MIGDENHPMVDWIIERFKTHPQEFEILQVRHPQIRSIFNEWKTKHVPTNLHTEGYCLYTVRYSHESEQLVPDEMISVGEKLEKAVIEWYNSYQKPKQDKELKEKIKKNKEKSKAFWDKKFKEITGEA